MSELRSSGTLLCADVIALTSIFLRFRQTLRLGLRVADGFGQHLAQLSLGLSRFSRGFLPLGHLQHVVMVDRE